MWNIKDTISSISAGNPPWSSKPNRDSSSNFDGKRLSSASQMLLYLNNY